ncbi:phosphoglucomutase [Glutamicibacter halophytocola]|uniref:Alpha-D-glucose phosphate-specific phosphoglucomutase n=2 Tax=Glutamicibacter halophytocola TaxID=1933880 RepID=A0ABX5YBF3_9MICC|nr:phosphoglucomutase (alpha-D-glucose-1,6-bisphosphate-dependent) [Glutamicibacter halophytocola]ALG27603.1 phosphoglucomutase [Glutamicibacter halophytocola]MBF6673655.1 alpha-D-glucose phosphate-specific phosphoglucomutase [Glutamicibacter sp. FBE19]QDY66986.1 alpha-D-glucose phosphate-specific phosphoglucomutase [Glutamicibacter halophytocola]
MAHLRAGQPANESDLINLQEVLDAYSSIIPSSDNPDQAVIFGTSGHRGTSLNGTFNEAHIAAITQAVVDYRVAAGITGPMYVGKDSHALSDPAYQTALEVLAGNGIEVLADDGLTPTPAVSHAILVHNAKGGDQADGLIITPSHNPPTDGGIKYNPPHGGPAESEITGPIAARANELLANGQIKRGEAAATPFDFRELYIADLAEVIDFKVIAESGISIGADPLGGASVHYWGEIGRRYGLNLEVVNESVDPRFGFMTLDKDGKIRMDCSSAHAMASLVANREKYDIATGNDADADRHGIVTPDAGLMNPNHFLAVAIDYLLTHRGNWPEDAEIGKTLVSSVLIDKVVASHGRTLREVPVGFKYFVEPLASGKVAFCGEESAGASFLDLSGKAFSTDKDGLMLALLASEMRAVTGKSPSQLHAQLVERHGSSFYDRFDAPANREQKAVLSKLDPSMVSATELAGDAITAKVTEAAGFAIGGLKVSSEHAWFAARPSGTEDIYKIYAESTKSPEHLQQVLAEARVIVDAALAG